jgi:hypothetical protein
VPDRVDPPSGAVQEAAARQRRDRAKLIELPSLSKSEEGNAACGADAVVLVDPPVNLTYSMPRNGR